MKDMAHGQCEEKARDEVAGSSDGSESSFYCR